MQGPPSSTYLGPVPFPYPAGDISPGGMQQLNAEVSMSGQLAHSKYPLIVPGSYIYRGTVCPFQAHTFVTPPPANNGGLPKITTTVPTFTVDTASYPDASLPHSLGEANPEALFLLPLGPPRNLFQTAPLASLLDERLAFSPQDQNPPSSNPDEIVFLRNTTVGTPGGLPPDPSTSGGDSSGFVMTSANTTVSYSKAYGTTFRTVNLTKASGFSDLARPKRTDFFPQSDGGLCGDQVLLYVPGRNLMVWLLQYWSPNIASGAVIQKGQNRIRIAWTTPQATAADFLHAWRWCDVSPATLGDSVATDWMDYPDLAYSNGFLYISVDNGYWAGVILGQKVYTNRRFFISASLDDMAGNNSAVNLIYYEPIQSGLFKAHFVQSAPDTMYCTALTDTSDLSVFADPDASPYIPAPQKIVVSSFCPSTATSGCDFTVNAPDNLNWNVAGPAPGQIVGATYLAPSFLCGGPCDFPTHR